MDIATIGLSVLLLTAPGSGPAPPRAVIATALARAAKAPATVIGADRLARRTAPQVPLRMCPTARPFGVPRTRASRLVLA
jgi:hypothetical protein